MTCVLPCVITIIHIHAWLPCVIHMAPQKAMAMQGCHVSLHMSAIGNIAMNWCHVSSKMEPPSNQVELVLLLMMTINGIPITAILVCFGRFWAHWKAYQEHNLALIPLLRSEARKALQVFIQNNDCSGRC